MSRTRVSIWSAARIRLLGLLLGLLLGGLVSLNASAQRVHVDRRHGFQIQPPKGWTQIPIRIQEKWIVAKFQSDREYECKEEFAPRHRPLMKIIFFPEPDKTIASEGGEEDQVEVEEDDDSGSITIIIDNPYKDYMDYIKRNFSEGGFYESDRVETEFGGTPVTLMELKVEKLARYGEKRFITGIFHSDRGDYAVEVDSLEDRYSKLKPKYLKSIRSFRIIPITEEAEDEEEDTSGGITIDTDGEPDTPQEKKQKRIEAQEKAFKLAIQNLPEGWTHTRTAHFLILNHAKKKFLQKTATQAEAVRNWLDQTFGDVGEGYVQHGIIRICADRDEESAYRKGSGGLFFSGSQTREIVISAISDAERREWEYEYLNASIMRQFFSHKNEMLYTSMPTWLESGLEQYVGTATAKGKRLVFQPDQTEKRRMREGRRAGAFKTIRQLFEMTSRELWQDESGWYLNAQCVSIIRYLMDGPGRRNKKTRTLIRDYMANLLEVVEEQEAGRDKELGASGSKEPMTEEEEEEAFRKRKKRQEEWSKREKERLQKTAEATFGDWSDAFWEALNKDWEKWSK